MRPQCRRQAVQYSVDVAVRSGVARRNLVEMPRFVRVPHHIDCAAKARPAHPADDDGIKMIERPEKAVDEANTV